MKSDHTVSFVARVDSSNAFSYSIKVAWRVFKAGWIANNTYNIIKTENNVGTDAGFSQDEVDRVVDHLGSSEMLISVF
jgi:hypothetical protein